MTTGEVVETIVNTSDEQWTDEDGTEEVPPEAKKKKNEKYLHVYHACKSRSYQDGGIVVFSLKKNAVQRWLFTAHSRALFTSWYHEYPEV